MNLTEIKKQVEELNELRAALGVPTSGSNGTHPYPVGKNVYVRTVTFHYTGRLVNVHPQEIVIIGRGSIVDVSAWAHALPREQK